MEQAAGVYARLIYTYLLDLIDADLGAMIELSVASDADVPYFAQAFPELTVTAQRAGDLGERMQSSFDRAFSAGHNRVVLTGSDIPGLDSALVRTAFNALEKDTVVIGPAADGGYYLIGMHAPGVPLFGGISWSSDRVLAQTEAMAHQHTHSIAYLEERSDIDVHQDFVQWRQSLAARKKG
jgi:hypothetical protein